MKIILKVGGMMCANCERHVTEALEKIKGVTEVSIDLSSGNVAIQTSKVVKEAQIKSAIEDAGYRLLDIKIEK